ncbi:MAG TPA: type II toxin-antitoxin system VapC family toxin [Micromonosporaceae bacterium]|nr:type II toxin-antitoxin system VapC family toxin [Micromonosporaceae bacterium]
MRLLLDTHVVLWWLADDARLTDDLKHVLDTDPDVYVSAASVWEVVIKQAIGKIRAPVDLAERISDVGFRELPIASRHAVAVSGLPPIHRDPFDRVLVAQAQCEDLTLVTRDVNIRRYDVPTLVV